MNENIIYLLKLVLFYFAHILCGILFGAFTIGFIGAVLGGLLGHFVGQQALTNLMMK